MASKMEGILMLTPEFEVYSCTSEYPCLQEIRNKLFGDWGIMPATYFICLRGKKILCSILVNNFSEL